MSKQTSDYEGISKHSASDSNYDYVTDRHIVSAHNYLLNRLGGAYQHLFICLFICPFNYAFNMSCSSYTVFAGKQNKTNLNESSK